MISAVLESVYGVWDWARNCPKVDKENLWLRGWFLSWITGNNWRSLGWERLDEVSCGWEWDCFQWDRSCLQHYLLQRTKCENDVEIRAGQVHTGETQTCSKPWNEFEGRQWRSMSLDFQPGAVLLGIFVPCLGIWNGEPRTESVQETDWVNLGASRVSYWKSPAGHWLVEPGVWGRMKIWD